MKIVMLASLATLLLASAPFAAAQSQANHADEGSTYRETALFNQVVGDKRYVGAFVTGPNRCDVTLFETAAADSMLSGPKRRMVLPIAAGASGVLGVGHGAELAIACTSDAGAIRVAPQSRPSVNTVGEN